MVNRKGGLSGKQKASMLKAKRAPPPPNKAKPSAQNDTPSGASTSDAGGLRMVQQVSRKGGLNTLSTRFVREDDAVVQARKLRGGEAFGARPALLAPLAYSSDTSRHLGLPTRKFGEYEANAALQEAAERATFDEWLASIHGTHSIDDLSPFEHNLEVWRQLWRCLERSDVICIIADARNPLLNVPAALYEYCTGGGGDENGGRKRHLRLVIVLSKVDLLTPDALQKWKTYLSTRFPKASLALFSSKGKEVGGSLGGGVASRRKAISAPLTAKSRQVVREYVDGIGAACGVVFPRTDAEDNGKGGVVAVGVEEAATEEDEEDEEESGEKVGLDWWAAHKDDEAVLDNDEVFSG